ncbi:MAG: hypothetical protein AAGD38_08135 [Acidobacteriota bacterium]
MTATTLTLAGCASVPSVPDVYFDAQDRDRAIRARGLDPARVADPYVVTPHMREWLMAQIDPNMDSETLLSVLAEDILDPERMALTYDHDATGTASEVFANRRANCLAFTNLFVALARDLDLPVYFVMVDGYEGFRRKGDLIVASEHIAVGYGFPDGKLVLDVSYGEVEYREVRRISDLAALSLFHGNRGGEALMAGDLDTAVEWLEVAVGLDPTIAANWTTYGVALRRSADLAGAENAYRKAIELDPSATSAASNLAALLRMLDREQEAREIELALADASGRNPYTYLALGDLSLRWGRYDEARRMYRRALRLTDDVPMGMQPAEPMAALGHVAMLDGDRRTARRMLRKALDVNADEPRALRLATALDRP